MDWFNDLQDIFGGDKSEKRASWLDSIESTLNSLTRQPLNVSARAYRNEALSADELSALAAHLQSWRSLLARNGTAYDGIIVNGAYKPDGRLLYSLSVSVDTELFPAALPLLFDALFELRNTFESVEWRIYCIEQVVTEVHVSSNERGFVPGRRVFGQQMQGLAGPGEDSTVVLEGRHGN
jgi:hypothetical protein